MKQPQFEKYEPVMSPSESEVSKFDEVHRELETKYSTRKLSIHNITHGGLIQSEGTIDDMLYYFRFRYNCAELTVGVPDLEYRYELHTKWEAKKETRREEFIASLGNVELEENNIEIALALLNTEPKAYDPTEVVYPPERKLYWSTASYLFDNEPYANDMNAEQYSQTFSWLIENLKPVPKEKQKLVIGF